MAYWLLKTEPSEFSIDDLEALGSKTEPWDGIRNYQARNIMRDKIKVGDKALIYHSSCKDVGAVGTAEVVENAYPDPAQFNPKSKYYDPKSNRDNPRWVCVGVKFLSKFDNIVALKQIKSTPALAEMVLVKQGRLSVQPVTAKEWKVINQMAKG
ncbi:EVE domain-containing protein [Aliikangiella marina]|uniref:EVE domain-containing protein n=1 Tax=Aliikangiella marina TaxID=1712262 RepID=A0A545THX4_9GAMM|nr:EVE domain-containing protein [Aliikangiella marina]TQV76761.1 EVE domain-containing protein [Aliikangiella marina]